MIGPRSARRAARFARAVDADQRPRKPHGEPAQHGQHQQGGEHRDPVDARTRELLAVVERLRAAHLPAGPHPQFRERLRQQLLAAAAEELPRQAEQAAARATRTPPRPAATAKPRLAFVAAMLIMMVGLSGLAIVASNRALPGDTLYALKRTTEGMSYALVRSDEGRARRLLDFAHTRAREVGEVVGARVDPDDSDLVRSTLGDMDLNTRDAAKLLITHAVTSVADDPLADLAAWTADQRALLDPLVERLSGDTARRAVQSLALLDRIRGRVDALRSQLTCSCLDSLHGDDLGPLPCWPCEPAQAQQPPSTTPPQASETGAGPGSPVSPDAPGRPGSVPSDQATTPSGGAPPGTSPGTSPSPTPSDSGGLPGLPDLPTIPPPSDGGLLPPLLPTGLLPPLPPLLPGL